MIEKFIWNKDTDVAILLLRGKGFHQDLHRLCSVVKREHRKFDGQYWHIQYASQYTQQLKDWWPEFANWMNDFERQLQLPIGLADGETQSEVQTQATRIREGI
jgi:hypothetical protein